ncbi:MAG: CpsD/CapB family tyrosine-protein kinase [Actinomycetia bacterium]|nr:CpsD/CapB family tyrosine-protein kinase [Actinomycetes bacterium]MCP4963432.1 CpsD/CapB family tyrosine-protein kinase [Actinomycetes bacterium]
MAQTRSRRHDSASAAYGLRDVPGSRLARYGLVVVASVVCAAIAALFVYRSTEATQESYSSSMLIELYDSRQSGHYLAGVASGAPSTDRYDEVQFLNGSVFAAHVDDLVDSGEVIVFSASTDQEDSDSTIRLVIRSRVSGQAARLSVIFKAYLEYERASALSGIERQLLSAQITLDEASSDVAEYETELADLRAREASSDDITLATQRRNSAVSRVSSADKDLAAVRKRANELGERAVLIDAPASRLIRSGVSRARRAAWAFALTLLIVPVVFVALLVFRRRLRRSNDLAGFDSDIRPLPGVQTDSEVQPTVTRLLAARPSTSRQIVAIAGVQEGDGATGVAIAIAVEIARTGAATLLIDAAVDATASVRLNCGTVPGVAQVLDGATVKECLVASGLVDNLLVLPAGDPNHDGIAVSSRKICALIDEAVGVDVVVLDCSSLADPDTALPWLAISDDVVLVAKSGRYPVREGAAAAALLSEWTYGNRWLLLTGSNPLDR